MQISSFGGLPVLQNLSAVGIQQDSISNSTLLAATFIGLQNEAIWYIWMSV